MFDKKAQGINIVQIKPYIYHWKVLKTYIFKMILHFRFEVMNGMLRKKEKSGVKISIASLSPGKKALSTKEKNIQLPMGERVWEKLPPIFHFLIIFCL
jgi:hypothetical protein